jgi:hypothetical protein
VRQVRRVRRVRQVLVLLVCALPAVGVAQSTQQQQNVEVDPVQCWWRTSTPSVRIGEPFSLHLTCAALETDAATAVVDRSRLGAAAVQFPPFEVTGGSQSADHVTPGRRFMQYRYDLRLIAEEFFGSDVVIPAMTLTYRIESRVQADAAVQGREQNYELPALTIRVNSLVANDARHIRETAVPSLDDITAREFRARMFRLVALILFGVAGLTLAIALLRWLRAKRRGEMAASRHFLPHRAVLAGVRRELRDVQQQTRGGGWNLDALARALAAGRVVASYLSGQPVAQAQIDAPAGGQLTLSRGWFRRRKIAISAPVTGRSVRGHALAPDLDEALTTFTAARYGRLERYDNSALDDALAAALRAADRASSQHTWIAESLRSVGQAVRGWTPRAWAP